jgi:hypothetical protein
MSKFLNKILLVLLIASTWFVTGCSPFNKVALRSGSLAFLKNQGPVNVEYDYSDTSVGKFAREQDYVEKKVREYNQKEPGRGDRWRASWVGDRATRFQPKFESLLNTHVADKSTNLKFGPFKEAKYTLLLKTTFTEPGWNIFISHHPALISADAIFFESQNRNNIVGVVTITKATGQDAMGFDSETGFRLQESYAKAGKELGKFIRNKLK